MKKKSKVSSNYKEEFSKEIDSTKSFTNQSSVSDSNSSSKKKKSHSDYRLGRS